MRLILVSLLLIGVVLAGYDYQPCLIVTNSRLYQRYLLCLTNKGPCLPDARKLKVDLRNSCAKCKEREKAAIQQLFKCILETRKDDFDTLGKMYNITGFVTE